MHKLRKDSVRAMERSKFIKHINRAKDRESLYMYITAKELFKGQLRVENLNRFSEGNILRTSGIIRYFHH